MSRESQKRRIRARLESQKARAREPRGVESWEYEEERYTREITNSVVDPITSIVRQFVFPALDSVLSDDYALADVDINILLTTLNNALRPGSDFTKMVTGIALAHVQRVDARHAMDFTAEIRKAIGVDISSILTDQGINESLIEATRTSVNLIKRILRSYSARTRSIIRQGFAAGNDSFSIKKELMNVAGIEKRHAKLIARDQTSKLTSDLNRIRQEDIGVTHYIWRTVGDESVRPTHANNNRKSFPWAHSPPQTGHPGNDVQCRCIADPDLSPILGPDPDEKKRRLQKRPVK